MTAPVPDGSGVSHNLASNRFEVNADGGLAVLEYIRRGNEIVMTHTFVPPELRGRGHAELLVRAALAFAAANQLRVVPACSYVDRFIQRHPEFQGLVA